MDNGATAERISQSDIDRYKREVLESCVMVTPREAARILSCSTRTIYSLVEIGEIPAYNRSPRLKGLRLLAADLVAYVKKIRVDTAIWLE